MAKTYLLRVRLNAVEHEELSRRAAQRHLTVSEYVRFCAIGRDLEMQTRLRRVEVLLEEALQHARL